MVGNSAIATAEPDGYTLGIATVEIAMMHWAGLTDLTYENYTVFGQVNLDPGGLMVGTDSPYGNAEELEGLRIVEVAQGAPGAVCPVDENAEELLEAMKSEPEGTFKASGTGQGGIWHLGFAGWMLSEDVDPNKVPWVPSQGSAPALNDMVAGGVDFVTSSLAEGRALIEAGKVRPLANMGETRLDLFPDVPTLKEATGSDWTIGAWRMVVGPKGIPEEVQEKVIPALQTAYDSDEYKEFMENRGFGMVWRPADEAYEFMAQADEDLGRVMKEAGLAK